MERSLAILAAGACACLVQAEQFLIEYSAASGLYPEVCGWTRSTHGGGAVRSIADGILTLDSTGSSMICDFYRVDRPITPGPGETFVAEWRVRVAQHSGYWEGLASARADDGGEVAFGYDTDRVFGYWEGWYVPVAPSVFHTYRLESASMYDYSLWINGTYAHGGVFVRPGAPNPTVWFGDGTYGAGTLSLTQWDYFRFGIAPEPGGIALALAACACVARRWPRGALFKGEY